MCPRRHQCRRRREWCRLRLNLRLLGFPPGPLSQTSIGIPTTTRPPDRHHAGLGSFHACLDIAPGFFRCPEPDRTDHENHPRPKPRTVVLSRPEMTEGFGDRLELRSRPLAGVGRAGRSRRDPGPRGASPDRRFDGRRSRLLTLDSHFNTRSNIVTVAGLNSKTSSQSDDGVGSASTSVPVGGPRRPGGLKSITGTGRRDLPGGGGDGINCSGRPRRFGGGRGGRTSFAGIGGDGHGGGLG